MALGDIVDIDDRTLLVLGQPLVFDKGQPDVASALPHRVDDTLFLIDTGVTTPFRDALLAAADRFGPLNTLRQLGFAPETTSVKARWARPATVTSDPTVGGLRKVAGAVAVGASFLRWRIQGRAR